MATCTIETTEQLLLFESLMEHSHSDCSLFMKAIDKIENISDSKKFSNSEKAKMIADLAASMVPEITSQAMNTSLEMTINDNDAKYEHSLLQAKKLLSDMQASAATQASNYEYLKVNAAQISADAHTKNAAVSTIKADIHDRRNSSSVVSKEINMLKTKKDTALQNYNTTEFSTQTKGYDVEINKYNSKTKEIGNNANIEYEYGKLHRDGNLIEKQTNVQERIVKSFTDNKYQHAANAESQMIATMIGADGWTNASVHLDAWKNSIKYLTGITYTQ